MKTLSEVFPDAEERPYLDSKEDYSRCWVCEGRSDAMLNFFAYMAHNPDKPFEIKDDHAYPVTGFKIQRHRGNKNNNVELVFRLSKVVAIGELELNKVAFEELKKVINEYDFDNVKTVD